MIKVNKWKDESDASKPIILRFDIWTKWDTFLPLKLTHFEKNSKKY